MKFALLGFIWTSILQTATGGTHPVFCVVFTTSMFAAVRVCDYIDLRNRRG